MDANISLEAQIFVLALAREGTFSRAAKKLHITQPALTARKQSEQYTGRSMRGLNGTWAWLPQREQITAKYSRDERSSPRS